MSENPLDVGQVLKAEREKRSITLDAVHEATKVPIDSLRAIEEGYKIRTLTSFYYKSFVRIYAQYLGFSEARIKELIPSDHPVAKKIVAPSKSSDTISLKLFARSSDNWFKRHIKVIVFVFVGMVGVMAIVGIVNKMREGRSAEVSVPSGKSKTAKPKSEARKTELAKTTASSQPAAKVAEASPQPKEGEVKALKKATLTVRAKATDYIIVKADGKTAFQGNLKKGTSETWTAAKKIELSGKGLDQLDYEVNGKAVGKISRSGAKVRKVIVTPEGLTVEK